MGTFNANRRISNQELRTPNGLVWLFRNETDGMTKPLQKAFYRLKPWIPRRVQIALRRHHACWTRARHRQVWPIDARAGAPPPNWPGWPHGKKFAVVLTHDVEGPAGFAKCRRLMEIDRAAGLRSAFYFVPARYDVPADLRQEFDAAGFEIGLHGYNHDGRLLSSRTLFDQRVRKINHYLAEWQASGFRAPSIHHDLDWFRDLHIAHDSSTFDTDPFQPQPDGIGTIFPFRVAGDAQRPGYLELPCTLPQDFTLFVLLQERTPAIWKQKLDWIAAHGGMALLDTHPDYMNLDSRPCRIDEYPRRFYDEFLEYLTQHYGDCFWSALPRDAARYCTGLDTVDPDISRRAGARNSEHRIQKPEA